MAAPSETTIQLSPEAEAQYERITRNLQEVTSGDVIRKVLSEGKVVKAYWGTAPTGRREFKAVGAAHWGYVNVCSPYRLLRPVAQDRRLFDCRCQCQGLACW